MNHQLTHLYQHTGAQLIQAIKTIPIGVTSLDLSWNALYEKTDVELAQVFAAINTNITFLYLSNNGLGNKTGVELSQAFKALPAGLTSLDLSSNDFHYKTGVELAEAFKALPARLTSLDFSYNILNGKTDDELAKVFEALPARMTHLNLTANGIGRKTSAELANVFKVLPDGLTSLNLSHNDLNKKTDAELAEAFKALKDNVSSLDLRGNGLFENYTRTQLAESFKVMLPANIKSVTLDLGIININDSITTLTEEKKQSIKNLESQFLLIVDKVKELNTRKNCEPAYKAANTLYTTLTELKDQYANGTMGYSDFKNQSLAAIKIARPELNQHRGWKEILGNIAYCILGLGIGYLAICAYKGSFFKFNTDSVNKLDELENNINAAAPAA